jgi:PiT family inorganic phosphate transporter
MMTVGRGITEMSPVAAFVAVAANAVVLFAFASDGLRAFLLASGLPAFPLVPVSSSQAIVGSIIGIGLVRGRGRGIHWRMLGEISLAWVATPVIAILVSFVSLFIVQNVFQQRTYIPVEYQITADAEGRLRENGIGTEGLAAIKGKTYRNASQFQKAILKHADLNEREAVFVMETAKVDRIMVTIDAVNQVNGSSLTKGQKQAFRKLWKRDFEHSWQLEEELAKISADWRIVPDDKEHNEKLRKDLDYVHRLIHATE